jgi:hypothetical protein
MGRIMMISMMITTALTSTAAFGDQTAMSLAITITAGLTMISAAAAFPAGAWADSTEVDFMAAAGFTVEGFMAVAGLAGATVAAADMEDKSKYNGI